MLRAPGQPPGPTIVWRRPVAWGALALAMALSAGLIWAWSSQETLVGDEWGYALRITTEPASQYLLHPPPGKHLTAIPLLAYKAAFEVFGIGSYAPYRLAHIVLLLVCAALFYVLVRRRVGDSLAILPAALLLFLGPAWEVLATPLRSPSLIAIAAGLGMLLALERRDLKGDIAACVLLAISLASHSTAFAFAAAAVVLVLSRPTPERWSRLWVFAIPIAAYAVWWFLAFEAGESRSFISNVVGLPAYFAESLADTVLAIAGLFTHASYGGLDIGGPVQTVLELVLIALLASVLIARFRRAQSISPFAWAILAALLVFWLATAFAPGPSRAPGASRYLYVDALLLLLLVCEFGRDLELPRTLTPAVAIAIVAFFAISMAFNVYELRAHERAINDASDRMRAGLTSLALAGGSVPPGFTLADTLAGRFLATDLVTKLAPPSLAQIFSKYGSPAYSPAELEGRSEPVRETADYVSLKLAGSELRPARGPAVSNGPAPRPLAAAGGRWGAASAGCIALRPTGNRASGLVSAEGSGLVLTASPGPAIAVSAGRFADGAPVRTGSVPGGGTALLELPETAGSPPWRVGVAADRRAVVCTA
jgi:hypothetical protein